LAVAGAFSMLLVTLWALTHRYHGFARDGELYAVQAMARIHPNLASDIYLQNTSQDDYTIFSPLYAAFIRVLGLQPAELALYLACTLGFLAAAWLLVRELSTAAQAWLALALLISTTGYYGAYRIFSYSENYLSARSMGEMLIVIALASHFGRQRAVALGIGIAAMFVHPLMALPGLILLICVWLPIRAACICTVAGIIGVLAFVGIVTVLPQAARHVTLMDAAWLEVVRERSQFLFLRYWRLDDWEIALRPFACLSVTALAVPDPRVRKLAVSAMLVGAAGYAVAWIAGAGSIAILLQGQAWRWAWITGFTSVVLLVPTVGRVLEDEKCGPLCALLLVLGWTYSGAGGMELADGALLLWLTRARISGRTARHLYWTAWALGIAVVVWVIANCWTFSSSAIAESGRESVVIGRLREIFALGVPAFMLAGAGHYALGWLRPTWGVFMICAAFLAASAAILPGSLKQLQNVGTPAEIAEFADWRRVIPPTSNVLVLPTRKSASFMWFSLGRPSYLSVDQSSGVVFSRATSMEIRRRSEVLLPVSEPDWKILSQITEEQENRKNHVAPRDLSPRPLTAASLVAVCSDPQLGFVIAKEDVGFDPVRHLHAGDWRNWNLYDCERVRSPHVAT